MTVTAIVGACWGDEGKGKTTDYLARQADFVVRFQGGNNAGHTIINDLGKFALHLLPSGVFYPHITNILGPGVAVNISAFLKELSDLTARGVPHPKIFISDRAQAVLPFHLLLDQYEEERLGNRKFGSTRTGMAPFYADKYMKIGVQMADLLDEKRLKDRLETSLVPKNILFQHLYHKPMISIDEIMSELRESIEKIQPFLSDTTLLLQRALAEEKNILLEGQLGALRDPDHGIYPFPTSSSPLAGFGAVGAGVPPYAIRRVVAVVKAYSSCVGAGPFVSEIFGPEAQELRERGGDAGEYGATTGRPRRMGWFDAVAARYGCLIQGATEAALTNLDVLGYREEISICIAYEINGAKTGQFPVSSRLDSAKPMMEMLPGWKCDISSVRQFHDLPKPAQAYILRIEELIGVPIKYVSIGPQRDAMIIR